VRVCARVCDGVGVKVAFESQRLDETKEIAFLVQGLKPGAFFKRWV
jgi:hypothetical protein